MNEIIGQLLPYALGIAISPLPIIAVLLMLLSERARSNGLAFGIGWLGGVIASLTVFVLLASLIPKSPAETSHPISGAIHILLSLGLLFLAWKQWNSRPRPGQQQKQAKWMSSVGSFSAPKAFFLAVALAALNPKNLMLSAGAGVSLGDSSLSTGEIVLSSAIFALLASITVIGPLIAYLCASRALQLPLQRLQEWLTQSSSVIMCVLLLVLGVAMLGNGISAF